MIFSVSSQVCCWLHLHVYIAMRHYDCHVQKQSVKLILYHIFDSMPQVNLNEYIRFGWLSTRINHIAADSVTPVTLKKKKKIKAICTPVESCRRVRYTFEGNIPNAVSSRGPGLWLHVIRLSALGRKQWKSTPPPLTHTLTHSVYILPPPSPQFLLAVTLQIVPSRNR